jgi:hypothetical protein
VNDQLKETDVDRLCSTHVRMTNTYKDFGKKPEIKRAFGRPICRWKDVIKICFRKLLG